MYRTASLASLQGRVAASFMYSAITHKRYACSFVGRVAWTTRAAFSALLAAVLSSSTCHNAHTEFRHHRMRPCLLPQGMHIFERRGPHTVEVEIDRSSRLDFDRMVPYGTTAYSNGRLPRCRQAGHLFDSCTRSPRCCRWRYGARSQQSLARMNTASRLK